jgi:hypothetical protein
LSNRVDNKFYPLKDFESIKNILNFFKNECVQPGKKIGDKSILKFGTFSQSPIIKIDIGQIEDISTKQFFVNHKLNQELLTFSKNIKNRYRVERNPGLDLISLLIEKINNQDIVKLNKDHTFRNRKLVDVFDNHIFIFTDGYLEYLKTGSSGQFYFGANEINKLRLYCLKNKLNVNEALIKKPELGLTPYKINNNMLVNLHVYETLERDKDPKLLVYKNPVGLRDNEILEAVWRKWATESGFKSFEWKKY